MKNKVLEHIKEDKFILRWAVIITYAFLLYNLPYLVDGFQKAGRIINPIIYGFIIAYLLNPLINFIQKILNKVFIKTKDNHKRYIRALSIISGYALLLFTLFLLTVVVIPKSIQSLDNITKMLPVLIPQWIDTVNEWLLQYLNKFEVHNHTIESITKEMTDFLMPTIQTSSIISTLFNATKGFTTFIISLILGFIMSVYMIISKDFYKDGLTKVLYAYIPKSKAESVIKWLGSVNDTFSGFISARLIGSLIVGIIAYIGILIMGLNNAMLLAVIIGFTNVIPYFGPVIGAIPASLIVLVDGFPQMVAFIIFVIVLQQFDGNYLGPKLIGKKLSMNSLLVIIAVVVMTGILGVAGMFIGIPLFAVLYVFISGDIKNRLRKKGLDESTKT